MFISFLPLFLPNFLERKEEIERLWKREREREVASHSGHINSNWSEHDDIIIHLFPRCKKKLLFSILVSFHFMHVDKDSSSLIWSFSLIIITCIRVLFYGPSRDDRTSMRSERDSKREVQRERGRDRKRKKESKETKIVILICNN